MPSYVKSYGGRPVSNSQGIRRHIKNEAQSVASLSHCLADTLEDGKASFGRFFLGMRGTWVPESRGTFCLLRIMNSFLSISGCAGRLRFVCIMGNRQLRAGPLFNRLEVVTTGMAASCETTSIASLLTNSLIKLRRSSENGPFASTSSATSSSPASCSLSAASFPPTSSPGSSCSKTTSIAPI